MILFRTSSTDGNSILVPQKNNKGTVENKLSMAMVSAFFATQNRALQ
jgi:hypothetical protein